MFLGLRSLIYPAPDLAALKAVFTAILGKEPYFDEPFYVGFNVGGYELGLWPGGDPADGPGTYWGVDNIDTALASLVALGAAPRRDISEVGEGIRMVDVTLPTGEVFGIIENPVFVAGPTPAIHSGPGR